MRAVQMPAPRISSARDPSPSKSYFRPVSAPVVGGTTLPHINGRSTPSPTPKAASPDTARPESQHSPLKQRLGALSGRLSSLQSGAQDEKLARREAWEAQIKTLEEKLTGVKDVCDAKIHGWKEDVAKTAQAIKVEKEAREILEGKKKKEIKAVETTIAHQLAIQQQVRKEAFDKLDLQVQEPSQLILQEVRSMQSEREDGEARRAQVLQEETEQLAKDIHNTVQTRQSTESRLAQALQQEVARLQEQLKTERRSRDQMEASMKNIMHDIEADLKRAIQEQASARIAMEENLMRLLEDTASRIEYGLNTA